MSYLIGAGAFAYGAVVGGIVYYFIARMVKHDPQALQTVLTLIAGAVVLAFLQRLGMGDPEHQNVATAMYPIGLLAGWGLPVLFKWDRDERTAEREAPKSKSD